VAHLVEVVERADPARHLKAAPLGAGLGDALCALLLGLDLGDVLADLLQFGVERVPADLLVIVEGAFARLTVNAAELGLDLLGPRPQDVDVLHRRSPFRRVLVRITVRLCAGDNPEWSGAGAGSGSGVG
jgi:hypothetical protein